MHALHVQSLSHWAPACIGPYSQATFVPCWGLVFLAGQISLHPPTHELAHADSWQQQAALVRQHLKRVLSGMPFARSSLRHVVLWNVFLAAGILATAGDQGQIAASVRRILRIPAESSVRWFVADVLPKGAFIEVQVVARHIGL